MAGSGCHVTNAKGDMLSMNLFYLPLKGVHKFVMNVDQGCAYTLATGKNPREGILDFPVKLSIDHPAREIWAVDEKNQPLAKIVNLGMPPGFEASVV